MVLKGSVTRSMGHAGRLATHLLNEKDNDRVEVLEITGQNTDDPKKAMLLMHGAVALTKGRNGLFQVSINPEKGETMTQDQWKDSIARIETQFGFEGQARVVIGHLKEGREHIHCVWQRTDYETEKVIPIDDYKTRLKGLAREMEREYGHREINDRTISQKFDQGAHRQAKRIEDRNPPDRSEYIRQSWEQSRTPDEFVSQLRAGGYDLAQGNKSRFVLMHSETGEILGTLSRHLKTPNQAGPKAAKLRSWAKGLSEPLSTVEAMKQVIEDRQYFDRDRYEAEQQDRIEKAAIEKEKEGSDQGEAGDTSSGGRQPGYDDIHLRKLDEQRALEAREDRLRYQNEAEMAAFYKRQDQIAALAKKRAEFAKSQGIRGQVTGRKAGLEEEIHALEKALENTDQRISEQRGAVEARIAQERAELAAEKMRHAKEYKKQMEQRQAERGPDQGLDMGK